MKAMILAAGLGTRLHPYTLTLPKAMVSFRGKPMIEGLMKRLSAFGIREFVVNLHHHGDKLQKYLSSMDDKGMIVHFSDERGLLLDTGGAIKHAADYFMEEECFLVHNVDVFTNLDVHAMESFHRASGAMATLAVRDRESSRYFLFDEEMKLRGWKNDRTGLCKGVSDQNDSLKALAFSGVQIMSPKIFNSFPDHDRFGLVDFYLKVVSSGGVLKGYQHDKDFWYDLGTPDKLAI